MVKCVFKTSVWDTNGDCHTWKYEAELETCPLAGDRAVLPFGDDPEDEFIFDVHRRLLFVGNQGVVVLTDKKYWSEPLFVNGKLHGMSPEAVADFGRDMEMGGWAREIEPTREPLHRTT